jgi:hypothetical protein
MVKSDLKVDSGWKKICHEFKAFISFRHLLDFGIRIKSQGAVG